MPARQSDNDRFPQREIEQSIPQRFAAQVAIHRDRPAIVTEHGSITYAQLDRASDHIAGALEAYGHEPGMPVAFLVEQGIRQIATILGVLKHGGIYVPLDPAWTRERLRSTVEAADSPVILADRVNASMARLIGGAGRRVMNVDGDLSPFPAPPNAPRITPDAFAYIYYTSGSTGQVKGVVDDHRNVLHNVARYTNSLQVTPDDRLTLLQSCGFSGAVSNIFTALLNGAMLLPFDVRARGVPALARWLADVRPTIYHSVPALFRQVMACGVPLQSLRIIRLEGDASRAIDVDIFNRHFDARCVLVNGLGATETGLSAQCFIRWGDAVTGPVVPVGYATQDMTISVVDARGEPVPPGELGEVVVSSPYVARGYWKRPDLTAAAFTAGDGAMRSYRTRDLGRIDADGRLECHGRIDLLTKIRGEWVDLGAIERALAECEGVNDAIVTVTEDGAGTALLTGFAVVDSVESASSDRLRQQLANGSLPNHAVPSQIVLLDRWPLDANGKVDRRTLATVKNTPRTGVEPRTRMERLVADAFSAVLNVPAVAATDDFFALGGDSLKAVEVSLELSRRTRSEIVLSAFQHATTVEALAKNIEGDAESGSLVRLQPRGDEPPVFCVHAHMGHVFNLRELASQFAPERPFYGLQAKGLDGMTAPERTIDAMAAGYVECIRRERVRGPYVIAGYCFGSWVAIEMGRQLLAHGDTVAELLLIAPDLPPEMARPGRTATVTQRVAWALSDARTRGLAGLGRSPAARRWPLSRAVPQPSTALALIGLDYRPRPYPGVATIFTPDGAMVDDAARDAWKRIVPGALEFVPLAGNATDVLRQPYVRDVAAAMMARLY